MAKPNKRSRRSSLEELEKIPEYAKATESRRTIPMDDIKHPSQKTGNHFRVRLTDEAMVIIKRQPKAAEFIFPYNSKSLSGRFTQW